MNSSNTYFVTQLVEMQKQAIQTLQDIEKQNRVETKKQVAMSIAVLFPSKFTEKELKQMMKALTINLRTKCLGKTKSGTPCQHAYQRKQSYLSTMNVS
mmetsp:Transcript_27012/g.38059  ORF Transcript_27012/g.38059 Transcript_27012/m.38059 type:complete len:98 (+) Transcript_27012:895-1188(+)